MSDPPGAERALVALLKAYWTFGSEIDKLLVARGATEFCETYNAPESVPRLVMAVLPFGEKRPEVSSDAFVHESAVVIGDVHVHEKASIWPCAVLRADDARIDVGRQSAVLDLALVEAPSEKPVAIGEGCLISHGSKLHGCTVMKGSLVGIGAIVLDGAIVGEGSVIAAGALVPPGANIPAGSFVIGVPGKVTREVSSAERRFVADEVRHVLEKVEVYRRAGPQL